METSDSGSASAAVVQSIDDAQSLALDTALLFQSGSYNECLVKLKQLLQRKEGDPKILHNKSVTEYLRDGCIDPQKFLDILSQIKGNVEDMANARASENSAIAKGNSGVVHTDSAGSVSGLAQESIICTEDYDDTSVLTFNIAVILYQLQRNAASMSFLESLYRDIEPIDESVALCICLLMLDVLLASRQSRKVAGVIQYMEKAFCSGLVNASGDGGGNVERESELKTTCKSQGAMQYAEKDFCPGPVNASGDGGGNVAIPSSLVESSNPAPIPNTDLIQMGVSPEDAQDNETLSPGLELDSSNSMRSAMVPPPPMPINLSRPPSVLHKDPKLILQLYRVRLLLLMRNLKAAKREIKFVMNLARGREYVTALMLKAQLEYMRENHRKAIKLLTTCSNREPGINHMFLNNLGCIYSRLRKPSTAAVFFLRALTTPSSKASDKAVPGQDRSLAILYNCGLQHLSNGNPVLAFRCFQEAAWLYYKQPLLWLRLAECCISAFDKGLLDASGKQAPKKGSSKGVVEVKLIGEGRWRRVVVPSRDGFVALGERFGFKMEEDAAAAAVNELLDGDTDGALSEQKMSLVFARCCLYKAANLLSRLDSPPPPSPEAAAGEAEGSNGLPSANGALPKEGKASNGCAAVVALSVMSFEGEQRSERASIRRSVLADLAFVELSLENPLKALKAAESLLAEQPECPRPSFILAHMYAGEALCMLNRTKEAEPHLLACMQEDGGNEEAAAPEENLELKAGIASEGNIGEAQVGVATLSSLDTKVSLYVNLAAVHSMQGDLAQARHCAIQAVALSPSNTHAALSLVFVELLQGRTKEAVCLLKNCRRLCYTKNMEIRPPV